MLEHLICFLKGHSWYYLKPYIYYERRVCVRCGLKQKRNQNDVGRWGEND